MNSLRTIAARSLFVRGARTAGVSALAAGIGVSALLGLSGVASAKTLGYVAIDSCTGVSGKVIYTPGLRTTKLKSETAVLTGTTSGCSDVFSGALSGTGTITAVLSGNASKAAENFSGTFTINWPAGSGFNPSNGNLSVTESNGLETISGTVTSGFDTGTAMALQYVTVHNTGRGTALKPITAQTYVNTQALTLSRNEG